MQNEVSDRSPKDRGVPSWDGQVFWDEVEREIEALDSLDSLDYLEFLTADRLPIEPAPGFRRELREKLLDRAQRGRSS